MTESLSGAHGDRERQSNVPGGRPHKFKVSLSDEELARLMPRVVAQRVTMPRLLVESALSEQVGVTPAERRELLAELFAVHRLLASLANNVNQLARVANSSGHVPRETVPTLVRIREVADQVEARITELSF